MQNYKIFLIILTVLLFTSSTVSAHEKPKQAGQSIVENYTAAYNAKDAEAMGRLMHDDIQWLTVKDDQISITVQGKSDMVTGLTGYFKGPMTITSTLSGWGINSIYVSVVETASWTSKSGEKRAQSSNALYQIENGLIHRVWYFPEQPNTRPN